jgi:hypothetical protein
MIKEVTGRTNLPAFLTVSSNAVITFTRLVQKLLRCETQTDTQECRNLHTLLRHDITKNTEYYTEFFSFCPNITAKFRTIAIFKSLLSGSSRNCRYVHNCYCTSFIFLCTTIHELFVLKQNTDYMLQPPSTFEC